MICRICLELEQYLVSAQQPTSDSLLAGLSKAGMRNALNQKQEKIRKMTADMKKHQKSCLHPQSVDLIMNTPVR